MNRTIGFEESMLGDGGMRAIYKLTFSIQFVTLAVTEIFTGHHGRTYLVWGLEVESLLKLKGKRRLVIEGDCRGRGGGPLSIYNKKYKWLYTVGKLSGTETGTKECGLYPEMMEEVGMGLSSTGLHLGLLAVVDGRLGDRLGRGEDRGAGQQEKMRGRALRKEEGECLEKY